MQGDFQIKYGVVGDTLLSAIIHISFHDILINCSMSFVGATVSFFVSCLLRRLFLRKKKK
tara:strand:- start:23939 stop:24118 length:180 start_codon:yes stop_codon:yes gene_type:complete